MLVGCYQSGNGERQPQPFFPSRVYSDTLSLLIFFSFAFVQSGGSAAGVGWNSGIQLESVAVALRSLDAALLRVRVHTISIIPATAVAPLAVYVSLYNNLDSLNN